MKKENSDFIKGFLSYMLRGSILYDLATIEENIFYETKNGKGYSSTQGQNFLKGIDKTIKNFVISIPEKLKRHLIITVFDEVWGRKLILPKKENWEIKIES